MFPCSALWESWDGCSETAASGCEVSTSLSRILCRDIVVKVVFVPLEPLHGAMLFTGTNAALCGPCGHCLWLNPAHTTWPSYGCALSPGSVWESYRIPRNSSAGDGVAQLNSWGGPTGEGTPGQGSVGAQGMEGCAPGLWIWDWFCSSPAGDARTPLQRMHSCCHPEHSSWGLPAGLGQWWLSSCRD